MVTRVMSALPGMPRRPGAGRFFYPRKGYGQISDALHHAAVAAGASVHLDTNVTGVMVERGRVQSVEVSIAGETRMLPATYVLSTIPITVLARLVRTDGPPAPLEATRRLQQRSMVLVYLTLDVDQFTEFDAHYFPEGAIRISRLSEPKNYSLTQAPGRTVLCAELPCAQDGEEWSMNDEALGALVVRDLERAGLGPVPPVRHVQTRRLPHAYPLYTSGYREALDVLDRWLSGMEGLVTFGRQGLFAHDNTHHTMAMAYALVDCLGLDGSFEGAAWARARKSFEDHVVED
jgi:protoporphyrinogen oxidase